MKKFIMPMTKKLFLREYPFWPMPKWEDQVECIHCDKIINVKDSKFIDGLICCANAPECDGTVMDWISLEEDSEND